MSFANVSDSLFVSYNFPNELRPFIGRFMVRQDFGYYRGVALAVPLITLTTTTILNGTNLIRHKRESNKEAKWYKFPAVFYAITGGSVVLCGVLIPLSNYEIPRAIFSDFASNLIADEGELAFCAFQLGVNATLQDFFSSLSRDLRETPMSNGILSCIMAFATFINTIFTAKEIGKLKKTQAIGLVLCTCTFAFALFQVIKGYQINVVQMGRDPSIQDSYALSFAGFNDSCPMQLDPFQLNSG